MALRYRDPIGNAFELGKLLNEEPTLKVSTISRRLGTSRSTTYRLLQRAQEVLAIQVKNGVVTWVQEEKDPN